MTQRDRAWRRRITRTIAQRHEELKNLLARPKKDLTSPTMLKPHQQGKLSPVQDARRDGHLRQDALDWSFDPPSFGGAAQA